MAFFSSSITRMVLVAVLLVLAVSLALFGWAQSRATEHGMTSMLVGNIGSLSAALQASSRRAMLQGEEEAVDAMLADLGSDPQLQWAFITDAEGSVKFSSRKERASEQIAEVKPIYDSAGTFQELREGQGGPYVRSLVPFLNADACQKCHDSSLRVIGYLGLDVGVQTMVQQIDDQRRSFWIACALVLAALAMAISIVLNHLVGRPLRRITHIAQMAAEGDWSHANDRVVRRDEIGRLLEAFQALKANVGSLAGRAAEQAQAMGGAATDLLEASLSMRVAAAGTSEASQAASSLAVRVSDEVRSGAAGIEEMSASIQEVSRNAARAAKVATEAVQEAESATETVTQLGRSSLEVGDVIKAISSIAEQTNLLALNATIEAARAGSAGKGFAVVAHEVKELASQTAAATATVRAKIEAIQGSARGAVASIGRISTIIGQIHESQTSIAGAVEEQAATINEISRASSSAAQGSGEIADHLASVKQSAGLTCTEAERSEQHVHGMHDMVAQLDAAIGAITRVL